MTSDSEVWIEIVFDENLVLVPPSQKLYEGIDFEVFIEIAIKGGGVGSALIFCNKFISRYRWGHYFYPVSQRLRGFMRFQTLRRRRRPKYVLQKSIKTMNVGSLRMTDRSRSPEHYGSGTLFFEIGSKITELWAFKSLLLTQWVKSRAGHPFGFIYNLSITFLFDKYAQVTYRYNIQRTGQNIVKYGFYWQIIL